MKYRIWSHKTGYSKIQTAPRSLRESGFEKITSTPGGLGLLVYRNPETGEWMVETTHDETVVCRVKLKHEADYLEYLSHLAAPVQLMQEAAPF